MGHEVSSLVTVSWSDGGGGTELNAYQMLNNQQYSRGGAVAQALTGQIPLKLTWSDSHKEAKCLSYR